MATIARTKHEPIHQQDGPACELPDQRQVPLALLARRGAAATLHDLPLT